VVRFVCENFVPIAVDKQQLIHAAGAREKYAAERKLIEKFTGGKTEHLAVRLLTPEGESLTDKEIFRISSASDVLATLRDAVARFGPVTRRSIKASWEPADKGVGVRGDGSVRLSLTVRHTDRRDEAGQPVFDSIILTKDQWQSILPSDRTSGAIFEIPESTVREFTRALTATSDISNLIPPKELTTAKLTGVVHAAEGGRFQLRLTGELAGERKYVNGPEMLPGRTRLDGTLRLDSAGRPERLLLVGEGIFKMPWDKSPRPTAAVVEWRVK
jgi:hypothetical protein